MADIIEETSRYVMNTYRRFPVAWKKGKGVYLWDEAGKKYLDFLAGIAVNILGYNHPRIAYVLSKEATRPLHVSNLFHIPEQTALAKQIIELSFPGKVFFCNSGAEANETAIKIARKWGREHFDDARYEIVTATQSFHGRTLGALSATGQDRPRQGFEPLMPGFRQVPFGDEKAARKAVRPETCAIMIEPVQGEGGINIPSPLTDPQAPDRDDKNRKDH